MNGKTHTPCHSAADPRSGPQDMGENPHDSGRGHHTHPGLVSALLHRKQRCGLRHAHRHAGNDGLGQAAFRSFPDRHGRRTDLADSPFHAQKAPKGVLIGFGLILAGAIGNIIDSAFYGLIFSASTPDTVAHFGGHYAGFMMGKVVDMFYFPLFQWNSVPGFLDFLVDSRNYFFGAVFNLADAYISVAVVYLLIFHYKYFNK